MKTGSYARTRPTEMLVKEAGFMPLGWKIPATHRGIILFMSLLSGLAVEDDNKKRIFPQTSLKKGIIITASDPICKKTVNEDLFLKM